MRALMVLVAVVVGSVWSASLAQAQDRPRPIVEAVVGTSGYVDEVWDHFLTAGAAARWFVSPRLAIGPEILTQRGANDTANLSVTGNVTYDLVRDAPGRRVVPYLAAGGGYLRQRTIVGSGPGSSALQPFTSSEGTFSGGLGARIGFGSRFFVAPEFRLGWEPEMRFVTTIGFRPGR